MNYTSIFVSNSPNFPAAGLELRELEEAAGKTGQRLVVARATNEAGIDAAFALFDSERVGGILVAADPFFDTPGLLILR